MSFRRTEQTLVLAFLALVLFSGVVPPVSAGWNSQPYSFNGSYSQRVRCPLYAWHRVSVDEPWTSAPNVAVWAKTYGCCKDGMVFSGGTVTHTLTWSGSGAHDWTLIKEEIQFDHILEDLPAGYAQNTL